jgi:hypothetical protein
LTCAELLKTAAGSGSGGGRVRQRGCACLCTAGGSEGEGEHATAIAIRTAVANARFSTSCPLCAQRSTMHRFSSIGIQFSSGEGNGKRLRKGHYVDYSLMTLRVARAIPLLLLGTTACGDATITVTSNVPRQG